MYIYSVNDVYVYCLFIMSDFLTVLFYDCLIHVVF